MCINARVCVFVRTLTNDLDDFCQQNSVGDVLGQVLDEARAAGLGQVVVRPVSVDLSGRREMISLKLQMKRENNQLLQLRPTLPLHSAILLTGARNEVLGLRLPPTTQCVYGAGWAAGLGVWG